MEWKSLRVEVERPEAGGKIGEVGILVGNY